MPDHRSRTIPIASRLLICVLLAVVSLTVLGCRKPLFSPSEDRSQFDRYDRVRNRYEPQYIEDEFGRREPNLRGRLGPKG